MVFIYVMRCDGYIWARWCGFGLFVLRAHNFRPNNINPLNQGSMPCGLEVLYYKRFIFVNKGNI